MRDPLLAPEEVDAAGLDGWRRDGQVLHARFDTGTFAAGVDLVVRIGAAADAADHHPDVDLRYGHVDVRLTTHDSGGLTGRDVDLARTISALAADR